MHGRRPNGAPGIGILVVVAIAASALASAASASSRAAKQPELKPSKPYLNGRFTDKTVDRFIADLARAGVGVYRLGSSQPVERIRKPVSPMRLTAEQARNAALSATSHSGLAGAQLDSITPVSPELATRVPPTSALVAAYVREGTTRGARLARRIMGSQDWTQFQKIVFPSPVLVLFAADLSSVAQAETDPAESRSAEAPRHPSAPQLIAQLRPAQPATVCARFQNFALQTVQSVVRAMLLLSPLAISPEFESIVQRAVVLAQQGGLAFDPSVPLDISLVIPALVETVAIVATIDVLTTVLWPWSYRLEASPNPIRKAVGAENPIPGRFELEVRTVAPENWPADIEDCANQAGVKLPSLHPTGAAIVWTPLVQAPSDLVTAHGAAPAKVANDGTATWKFATTVEPNADGAETHGLVFTSAAVARPEIRELQTALVRALYLPASAFPPAAAILVPKINDALNRLAALQEVATQGTVLVAYHEPKAGKCPEGTWSEDVVGAIKRIDPSGNSTWTGSATMKLGANGSFSYSGELHAKSPTGTYDQTMSGAGTWSRAGNGMLNLSNALFAVSGTIVDFESGVTAPVQYSGPTGSIAYTCKGGVLTIKDLRTGYTADFSRA